MMQPAHHSLSYRTIEMSTELAKLAIMNTGDTVVSSSHLAGRSRFTQTIDLLLSFIRRYLPPFHWIIGRIFALTLFFYAKWLSATIQVCPPGVCPWRDNPSGAVLVTWHGEAPALLSALIAQKDSTSVMILIATDPRGDYLSLLCNWLGFQVIRGDSEHGGWEALAFIAGQVCRGALALITADGGGPALTAKVGAVALASVTHAPIIPIGADCYPAALERHKWDAARNPLPYGRVAVVCGPPMFVGAIPDLAAFESARQQLQDVLNQASQEARAYLNV